MVSTLHRLTDIVLEFTIRYIFQCGSASTTRSSRLFIGVCPATYVQIYLADDCRLVTNAGVRQLRSADTQTLVFGRTQSCFGDRTFTVAAPGLWNSLLSDIRQPSLSCGQFRHSLKTFFWVVGPRRSATCVNCALGTLLLTYLVNWIFTCVRILCDFTA